MRVRACRFLMIAVILCMTLLAGARARAGELVVNGGFETGNFGSAWAGRRV